MQVIGSKFNSEFCKFEFLYQQTKRKSQPFLAQTANGFLFTSKVEGSSNSKKKYVLVVNKGKRSCTVVLNFQVGHISWKLNFCALRKLTHALLEIPPPPSLCFYFNLIFFKSCTSWWKLGVIYNLCLGTVSDVPWCGYNQVFTDHKR